ncbi:MAG: hypothetical protein ACRCTJ_04200 [Brevinema sp.]
MTKVSFLSWDDNEWNGFLGLLLNNLTNILALSGLLIYAIKLPVALVFYKIIPAIGLSIFCASLFNTYIAY